MVIPALNEERHLAACLGSIAAATAGGAEVIVVDNGSTDATVAVARAHGARALIRPGVTISALRNAGARAGTGELIAFVDADCLVADDWLGFVRRRFEMLGAGVTGSFHRPPPDAGWFAETAGIIAADKRGGTNYVPSGNMIVSRQCFEAIGGFDERLETNEDVEFCHRARAAGFEVTADPAIVAVHLGVPRSFTDFFRRELWHGRSSFRVFWDDLKRVTNLRVVLYSLYFGAAIGAAAVSLPLIAFTGWGWWLAGASGAAFGGIAVWLCWRIGLRRRRAASLVAYNLLYGVVRGVVLLEVIAGTLAAAATPRLNRGRRTG